MLYAVRSAHVSAGLLGVVIGAGAIGGILGSLPSSGWGPRASASACVYVVGLLRVHVPLALVPLAARMHGMACC